MNNIALALSAACLFAIVGMSAPAKAAETTTQSWYFVTTTPQNSSSATYVWQDDIHRAPGLAPDLTSYFMDGAYVTPAMAFAPTFTSSLSAYTARNIAPAAFVARNSNSAISFENLPPVGSSPSAQDVLVINFSYVNRGADRSFTIRDDIFAPSGVIVSSSTLSRFLPTNEYAPFKLPLYFGDSTVESGMYGVRVRVYDPLQSMPVDENSFNFSFKR